MSNLGDLVDEIFVPEQYGADYEPEFHNWFYFEAYVYDPGAGTYDGAGINYVDFTFYKEDGTQVYYKRETTARYCSFGGGEPTCPALKIEPGAKWPGTDTPLTPGRYKLKMEAIPHDSSHAGAYWEIYFWIYGGNGNGNGNGNTLDLHAQIVQTGAGHNNDNVSGAMNYQVEAYDPNVDNYDGAGIDYVTLQIYYNGNKVYERKESNAKYCAFAGGEPNCNTWYFYDNNNQWPSGQSVSNGPHLLRATVKAKNGQEKTIERQISIDNS